jgi:hypothetical protein
MRLETVSSNPKPNWKNSSDQIKSTPKFIRKGLTVLVYPTEYSKTTVKGKWGDREVYIVETKEYGKIYVSPLQFVKISDMFNEDYSSAVTVTLE